MMSSSGSLTSSSATNSSVNNSSTSSNPSAPSARVLFPTNGTLTEPRAMPLK
jgi:hypothetical protein